jgi:hypothetical protein
MVRVCPHIYLYTRCSAEECVEVASGDCAFQALSCWSCRGFEFNGIARIIPNTCLATVIGTEVILPVAAVPCRGPSRAMELNYAERRGATNLLFCRAAGVSSRLPPGSEQMWRKVLGSASALRRGGWHYRSKARITAPSNGAVDVHGCCSFCAGHYMKERLASNERNDTVQPGRVLSFL